jgi:hypothetical protein
MEKKIKKRFKIVLAFFTIILSVLIIWYISFSAPYNWVGLYNTKELRENPQILEYFNDYKIERIKYLGNNTYEVFTDKDSFIIISDYSNNVTWKYKIFKYDKEFQYFTNPM